MGSEYKTLATLYGGLPAQDWLPSRSEAPASSELDYGTLISQYGAPPAQDRLPSLQEARVNPGVGLPGPGLYVRRPTGPGVAALPLRSPWQLWV